jgi:hypothetical protein
VPEAHASRVSRGWRHHGVPFPTPFDLDATYY